MNTKLGRHTVHGSHLARLNWLGG